jgi:hypothetical protein
MPVEIRELVIKVAVDESATGGGTGKNVQPESEPDVIVRICVEKVLEILKDQKER